MGSQTPKTCQLSPITCEFSPVTWLDLGGCGRATRCQCCKAGNDEERVGEGRNAESQIPKSCNLTVITYDFSSATYHLHLVVQEKNVLSQTAETWPLQPQIQSILESTNDCQLVRVEMNEQVLSAGAHDTGGTEKPTCRTRLGWVYF